MFIIKKLYAALTTSSLTSRLVSGTFWSVTGTVVARTLSVCAAVVVARAIGKEDFGALGIIQSTMLNFSFFIGSALGLTATKHIPEFKINNPIKAGKIIILTSVIAVISSLLISFLFYYFSYYISTKILANKELEQLVKIGAILLFFNTLNGSQIGVLSGFGSFKSIAKINFYTGIFSFIVLVMSALVWGLKGGVCALVINSFFTWYISNIAVRRECRVNSVPLKFIGIMSEISVIYKFCLPAFLSGIILGPLNWLCSAILVNQDNGYAEMGVFNAANQWFALVLFLPGLLSQVLLPLLSETLCLGDKNTANNLLKISLISNLLFSVPIILVISMFSRFIMSLYGNDFSEFGNVLVISVAAGGIYSIISPVTQIINANNKVWISFSSNLIWGLVFISLTLFLINYGALGLASARLFAYLVQFVFIYIIYKKYLYEN